MTDEIILERLRFAAQTVISESALRDAKFDLAEDVMRRMVMARLEAEVLAEHLVDEGVCPRCNASGLLTAEQVRALAPFYEPPKAQVMGVGV